MSFLLANFLGNANNSNASSTGAEDKQLIIEKLTAKMVNSAHLEDRKAAAQTIKSLARSHRLVAAIRSEIGTLALQALTDELKRDLEDEELAKIVLETLDILCSGGNNNSADHNSENSSSGSDGIEVQFCEILLKNEQNVTLLLDIMGDSDDFYLRFTSIQILMSLCTAQPFQLKSAVLNSPSGVSKVLDLLKDSREIVRNEGLLFCGALVRGNADLQKILAFQGAFEQVMQIIVEEEGPWAGPLIIQDAFNLISGMLNLNTANQTYFRHSICFKQLAGVMALPDSTEEGDVLWNRTRIYNYLAALSVLDGLLCKSNVDLEASQNSALKTNFLRPLLALAFTPKIPVEVSASALKCLSGLIWSNNRAQQEFAKEKLSKSPLVTGGIKVDLPISSLMGAVLLAVHSHDQSQEGLIQRFKSLDLVEAFCSNNPEGQLVLLSTIKSTSESSASPGSVIIEALFEIDTSRKRDPWHCWFASALLCHLINANENAKRILLKHTDEENDDGNEDILTSLMLSLIRSARDSRGSTCQKSIIGYLQLILIWFHEFPEAIGRFLQEGSYVQYLIERITNQSFTQDVQIQGLSALILGICVLFNDEGVKNFGSEGLKGIIKNRIGPDLFISKLSHLKSEKSEAISELTDEILLKNYESIMNLVARPTPAGTKASHTATLAQLTKDLSECRSLLVDTQNHLNQNGRLVETLKIGISERDAYILQLQKLISEKNQKIAQMAHEMSNLEQQQQQQYQTQNQRSDQDALNSLNETIRSFQETVARQQARIEELEALLNGYNNSELEKWKRAYHELYEQVQQQLDVNVPVITEDNDFENITVTSAFCPAENITVTSAFCPESVPPPPPPPPSEQQLQQESEPQNGHNVEVLSPSLFMSPLAAESEAVIVESEESFISGKSPELVTLNQLPGSDIVINEYPELKEPINTSFNAAVIISEEFAKNQPNPENDEPFISSECPPDNFLASGDSVEIVSKEEIRNVLDFFDKLPQESDVVSVGNSSEVKSILEGIDNLHVTENDYEVKENELAVAPEENVQETKNDEVIADYYTHDTDAVVQEESDYYAHQENSTDYVHEASQENLTVDHGHEDLQNYDSYNQNSKDIYQEYPSQSGYDDVAIEENVEEPVESKFDEIQPDYNFGGDQVKDSSFDYFSANNFDSGAHEQPQEYAETTTNNNDQDTYGQDQGDPTQSYDYTGAAQSYDEQQLSTEQSYENYYSESNYNYPETEPGTETEHVQDESTQFTEDKAVEDQPNQVIEDYTVPATDYAADYSQEYTTSDYNSEYTSEYTNDYYTGGDDNTTTDYSNHEQYDQSNTQEYTTEQQSYDNIDGIEQPHEHTYEESYSQSHDAAGCEATYVDGTTSHVNADQDSQTFDNSQVFDNSQSYNSNQVYNNSQVYDNSQSYDNTQVYDNVQAYDNSQVYDSNQAYNNGQVSDYSQVYDTSNSTQGYDNSQDTTYDNSQVIDQSDQNNSASSEYYYYDEATGYTYGFDQNVNQYYYYDPNTGEYTYYTAETTECAESEDVATATADTNMSYNINTNTEDQGSVASSNPSLFDTAGPPLISLQQHQPSSLSTNNFVIDHQQQEQQVYNL